MYGDLKLQLYHCCTTQSNLITDYTTGEIFCKQCGIVQGVDIQLSEHKTTSTLNLYLETQLGGLTRELTMSNPKIHIYSSDASPFSNLCDKLEIPTFIRKDIWRIYIILRKKTNLSKAKSACLSIFYNCRKNKFPLTEKDVIHLIQLNFNVKNVPNFLSVTSEANSFIDNGIPVLQKMGINTNKNHLPEYYLNSALNEIKHNYPPHQYQSIRSYALKIFPKLKGNSDTSARKAISIAKKRMRL